jgi:hypothetical protein
MKHLLSFLFFLFACNFIQSQSTISGTIKDAGNKPVAFANVFLKNKESQTIVAFVQANKEGKYSLNTNETGSFNVVFTAISFKLAVFPIIIKTNTYHIQDASLIDEVMVLNEVIITAEKPIVIKQDTIIFNAKSFALGNETVVEDLLRKIPGINVSENGTIRVGNKEVEKIMIDGDDFFENGYKIMTKNLNAGVVDKVEVYKRYSKNRLLKGIESSDKVALNLTLKKDIKSQWFGNFSSGYGLVSNNRYEVRTNLMSFGEKAKYYAIGNLNNTGIDATGDVSQLIRPTSSDEEDNLGHGESANSLLNMNVSKPNLKEERTNFNNAELASLNAIFTLSSKIKIKTLGFFNWDENDFFRNGTESFNINNVLFTNIESYILQKNKKIGFGKIDLNYDISKTQMIEYSGRINNSSENSQSNLLFNNELSNEKLNETNQLIEQKIVYTNKLKKSKVLMLTGIYIDEKIPQKYQNNIFLFQDLIPDNTISNAVSQISENKMKFFGFEVHLLNKKEKGNLFEVKSGFKNRYDVLNSKLSFNQDQSTFDAPNEYSNQGSYSVKDAYVKSKFNYFSGKFGLVANLELHQLFSTLKNFQVKDEKNSFFVNPSLIFLWQINKKNKISSLYSYNTTNAKILDVYDNFVLTSYRTFEKGTGEFNQLQASSFSINYNFGDWDTKFSSETYLYYYKNHDFFSTNTIIQPNYSLAEKIIINDKSMTKVSTNVSCFFKTIAATLKLDFDYTVSNYKNRVNSTDLREVKSKSFTFGLKLRSGFSGFFNYHLGSKWNVNQFQTTTTTNNRDNLTFLDLTFIINRKLNADIQAERYHFGNLDKENNKYNFLDLNVNYNVKKNKFTISITGKNLLNTKTFKQTYLSDIAFSTIEYRLLPRYAIFKMDYRF